MLGGWFAGPVAAVSSSDMEMDSLPNGNSNSGDTSPAAAVPPPPTTGKANQLAESLKLEHQFVRVPFEHLKKTMRANHRVVEKEMGAVISGVAEAAAGEMSKEEAVRHLTSLVFRLQGLKRKDLVDIDIFLEAKKVIDALQNKEVGPALAWCAENKSKLKKSKSKFEFQLRLQEFIELVRAEKNMRAVMYSRKYLSPWGATHMKELQRVMATLAFKSSTECATYKVLFDPKQWDYLVEQFKQEFYKLYGMTLEPLLNIFLQAGLSSLKTPFCYEEDCTKEDPLSQETFRKLAQPLPFSKQHHSKLVCYISKELMDADNPPLVLPNGYVYGTKALEDMAKKNGGRITCPRTSLVYNFSELAKVFIS
ncbi:Macrophage erythroblast attacher [Nymphaea thermarum]|nr:Macrophage erythroblast attacher [Nymphaea thermarum]